MCPKNQHQILLNCSTICSIHLAGLSKTHDRLPYTNKSKVLLLLTYNDHKFKMVSTSSVTQADILLNKPNRKRSETECSRDAKNDGPHRQAARSSQSSSTFGWKNTENPQ